MYLLWYLGIDMAQKTVSIRFPALNIWLEWSKMAQIHVFPCIGRWYGAQKGFHKITLPLLTPELNISSSMSPMHVLPQVSSCVLRRCKWGWHEIRRAAPSRISSMAWWLWKPSTEALSMFLLEETQHFTTIPVVPSTEIIVVSSRNSMKNVAVLPWHTWNCVVRNTKLLLATNPCDELVEIHNPSCTIAHFNEKAVFSSQFNEKCML